MKQIVTDIVFYLLPSFLKNGLCNKSLNTQSFPRLEKYCLVKEAIYMVDTENNQLESSIDLDVYSKRYRIEKKVSIIQVEKK